MGGAMVNRSRYFTNPSWENHVTIEWRKGVNLLFRHRNGASRPWLSKSSVYANDEDTLARCLRSVRRGTWIEIDGPIKSPNQEVPELANTPESEVTPW